MSITAYQGPIGSVITPHLRGLQSYKHLSYSSSLCGACTDTCPVKIDLHHHLLRNRPEAVRQKGGSAESLDFHPHPALPRTQIFSPTMARTSRG